MKPTHLFPAPALLAIVPCSAASCVDDDPFGISPEAQADRIRAHTPTELPPVTTEGAMTMGAYVETDTGRVLFVASGVERVDPIGSSSTDCDPFDAYRSESDSFIVVVGWWCSRPEVGDARQQTLIFYRYSDGQYQVFYSIQQDPGYTRRIRYASDTLDDSRVDVLLNDTINRTLAATFSAELYGQDGRDDTIDVTDGRLDVRYGRIP